jgi:hypothetical protein
VRCIAPRTTAPSQMDRTLRNPVCAVPKALHAPIVQAIDHRGTLYAIHGTGETYTARRRKGFTAQMLRALRPNRFEAISSPLEGADAVGIPRQRRTSFRKRPDKEYFRTPAGSHEVFCEQRVPITGVRPPAEEIHFNGVRDFDAFVPCLKPLPRPCSVPNGKFSP